MTEFAIRKLYLFCSWFGKEATLFYMCGPGTGRQCAAKHTSSFSFHSLQSIEGTVKCTVYFNKPVVDRFMHANH